MASAYHHGSFQRPSINHPVNGLANTTRRGEEQGDEDAQRAARIALPPTPSTETHASDAFPPKSNPTSHPPTLPFPSTPTSGVDQRVTANNADLHIADPTNDMTWAHDRETPNEPSDTSSPFVPQITNPANVPHSQPIPLRRTASVQTNTDTFSPSTLAAQIERRADSQGGLEPVEARQPRASESYSYQWPNSGSRITLELSSDNPAIATPTPPGFFAYPPANTASTTILNLSLSITNNNSRPPLPPTDSSSLPDTSSRYLEPNVGLDGRDQRRARISGSASQLESSKTDSHAVRNNQGSESTPRPDEPPTQINLPNLQASSQAGSEAGSTLLLPEKSRVTISSPESQTLPIQPDPVCENRDSVPVSPPQLHQDPTSQPQGTLSPSPVSEEEWLAQPAHHEAERDQPPALHQLQTSPNPWPDELRASNPNSMGNIDEDLRPRHPTDAPLDPRGYQPRRSRDARPSDPLPNPATLNNSPTLTPDAVDTPEANHNASPGICPSVDTEAPVSPTSPVSPPPRYSFLDPGGPNGGITTPPSLPPPASPGGQGSPEPQPHPAENSTPPRPRANPIQHVPQADPTQQTAQANPTPLNRQSSEFHLTLGSQLQTNTVSQPDQLTHAGEHQGSSHKNEQSSTPQANPGNGFVECLASCWAGFTAGLSYIFCCKCCRK
ncbi:hypothetical protein SISNIDRAFT_469876 [Sistotremastrum niveocremeum HHB9708]|uniref:Uncharacterized protein n=1 Tax=Sistotremastrum niveocremeum HHB9708 TaxID=1314777 RepID=A0A164PJX8_9AGAM|nr:hypothetical protein SISNIDRAFT_469876 [Sistotremastrum niveocremeum HHB9708]